MGELTLLANTLDSFLFWALCQIPKAASWCTTEISQTYSHAENCSWLHRDVPAHHCHGCFINVNIMHVHFWRSCCCSAVQKHSAGQWLQGCCLLHNLQPRPAEMLLLLNTNHAFVCFVSWAAAHMREKLRCTCGLTPAWGCFRGMTLTGKATAINTLLLITLGFV